MVTMLLSSLALDNVSTSRSVQRSHSLEDSGASRESKCLAASIRRLKPCILKAVLALEGAMVKEDKEPEVLRQGNVDEE